MEGDQGLQTAYAGAADENGGGAIAEGFGVEVGGGRESGDLVVV